jgi:hypothetical protein
MFLFYAFAISLSAAFIFWQPPPFIGGFLFLRFYINGKIIRFKNAICG